MRATPEHAKGTSLRVQGEQVQDVRTVDANGNIPACAGRTKRRRRLPLPLAEHPCVCRENCSSCSARPPLHGTSLRVQGEPYRNELRCPGNRNIPACAGRTVEGAQLPLRDAEHPCVCRENSRIRSLGGSWTGTSLRVQGEPLEMREIERLDREHPCVCRENSKWCCYTAGLTGTSLRVQGEHFRLRDHTSTRRNIPACAGRTSTGVRRHSRMQEHPCVCRENVPSSYPSLLSSGTSLRVQGEREHGQARGRRCRNIPACAGRTSGTLLSRRTSTEHPCVCRENSHYATSQTTVRGTSLRVQGELGNPAIRVNTKRNIPACAGRTQHGVRVRVAK